MSSKREIKTIEMENWMGQLSGQLTEMPIIYLSIPGSHNSFSYSLTRSSAISPDSPEIIQQLAKCFKPIVRRIVFNWSRGQSKNAMTQLCSGIRYFDIRLVCKNGDIYIAHGLYGDLIETFLQDIKLFLVSHQREIVILDFQHFYNFANKNHQFMMSLLEKIFGSVICRRTTQLDEISLNKLWQQGKQVISVYRHPHMNYTDLCWPSGCWVTPWPNKIDTNELLHYLDEGLTNRKDKIGYVSQGILTPTAKYLSLHLSSNLQKLALKNNKKLSKWLETKANGKKGINVVICDFVESYSFCEKVVMLNFKNDVSGND